MHNGLRVLHADLLRGAGPDRTFTHGLACNGNVGGTARLVTKGAITDGGISAACTSATDVLNPAAELIDLGPVSPPAPAPYRLAAP